MNHFINFSDKNFINAQKFSGAMAKKFGDFSSIELFQPNDIDSAFYEKNRLILDSPRGAGYWLWKPYFLYKKILSVDYGDNICYADSGSHLISRIDPLFQLLDNGTQEILPFELSQIEGEWTKRDAFILMDCDDNGFELLPQRLASFIILKKTPLSVKFCLDYLTYCSNPQIISDAENIYGKPNHPFFQDHRHDQSVFSLLTKKYEFKSFRDPSQWGNDRFDKFKNSPYPQIFEHTRQKHPKQAKLKYKIKRLFFFK